MNFTQLANKVAGLTTQLQNVISLGKRFDEFPVQENVNPDSKILVSTEGLSETLTVSKLLAAASNESQNNKVREVLLGVISDTNTFAEILDNTGILVESDELVFLSVFQPIEDGSEIEQFVQRLFLWKLGKGNFSPIGSDSIDSKLFELPSIYPSEQTADEIISAPYAIVRDYGTVYGTDILSLINNNNPPVSYDEDTEEISYIYYVRVTLDDVKYLYQFKGAPGMYGFESGQMVNPDLTLIFSSDTSGPVGVSEAYVLEKMNEALENANDYTNYKLETLTTTVVPEGSRQYHTAARVLATLLSGFTTISGPIVSTDSILIAFGKAQNALNSLAFSVGLRELASNKSNGPLGDSIDKFPTEHSVKNYVDSKLLQRTYSFNMRYSGGNPGNFNGLIELGTTPAFSVSTGATTLATIPVTTNVGNIFVAPFNMTLISVTGSSNYGVTSGVGNAVAVFARQKPTTTWINKIDCFEAVMQPQNYDYTVTSGVLIPKGYSVCLALGVNTGTYGLIGLTFQEVM